MKKRQIGALGLIVGQAIMMLKKDPELREKVKTEPGLLQKGKILGESRRAQNKEIVENIKEVNFDSLIKDIEKNVKVDADNIQQRTNEQGEKDWESEGHNAVRSIVGSMPDKKKLEDGIEKYKQRIIQWRENL